MLHRGVLSQPLEVTVLLHQNAREKKERKEEIHSEDKCKEEEDRINNYNN